MSVNRALMQYFNLLAVFHFCWFPQSATRTAPPLVILYLLRPCLWSAGPEMMELEDPGVTRVLYPTPYTQLP